MKKILIHHHATFNKTEENIYTRSFIAEWVNELTKYFFVGLLIHESRTAIKNNDTKLYSSVRLHSLGREGNRWDRIERINRIKKICLEVSCEYDLLIIRGITPRQYTIYKNCNTKHKLFFLVGSIKDSIPSFKKIFSNPYSYLMYYVRFIELFLISKNAHLVTNSKHVAKESERIFKLKNIDVIPTNTISKQIHFKRDYFIKKEINLIFVGRIEIDKGILELLSAFNELINDNYKFKLTFVGLYSTKIMEKIKNLKYWNQISSKVFFTGFVPYGNELFNLYKKSDIFILPSYHEGFPHAIWEAAAFDLPVIVSNVGGIRGFLNKEHVELIEPKSEKQIYNAINYILSNPKLSRKRILNLKQLLLENNLEKCVEKLNLKIKKIISVG